MSKLRLATVAAAAWMLLVPGATPAAGAPISGGTVQWAVTSGLPGMDSGSGILTPDGSAVLVSGDIEGSDGDQDILLLRRNASDGSPVWLRRAGSSTTDDWAWDAAVTPDGRTFVVVGSNWGDSDTWFVLAVNALTGERRWFERLTTATSANAVAIGPLGNRVFITGSTAGTRASNMLTRAYAVSTGRLLWQRHYSGPRGAGGSGWSIEVSPDGSQVVVAGEVKRANRDAVVVSMDAATGHVGWATFYEGPGREGGRHGSDILKALTFTSDGRWIFATGESVGRSTGFSDYLTMSLNASSGAKRWLATYDRAGGLDETVWTSPPVDGAHVYVTGQAHSSRDVSDAGVDTVTLAYDITSGDRAWKTRSGMSAWDAASGAILARDGSALFVAANRSGHGTGEDILLFAYSVADGAPLWHGTFDGAAHEHERGWIVGQSADGASVYLEGHTRTATTASDEVLISFAT